MSDSAHSRTVRLGWWVLAVGYSSHCVAHLAMWGETPTGVRVGGTVAVVLAVGVRVLIGRGHPASALALTVFGAALAVGLLAVHLPPYWGPFSQPWRGDVNLVCWITLGAAVGGGVVASAISASALRVRRPVRVLPNG